MSLANQLLLTLIKLRTNFTYSHLVFLFGRSKATISRVFRYNIEILSKSVSPLIKNVPAPYLCREIQPKAFLNSLTDKITLSIDCTDFKIVNDRKNLTNSCSFYSEYRGGQTLKALVAILPSGAIVFASDLFPGRISDKEICLQSGFIDQLDPGHCLVVDKGFKIFDICPAGVTLCIPSFRNMEQFTNHQALRSRVISSARSHVERVNERIKNYLILNRIPHQYRDIASDIFHVICFLINLQPPIIAEVEDQLNNTI